MTEILQARDELQCDTNGIFDLRACSEVAFAMLG